MQSVLAAIWCLMLTLAAIPFVLNIAPSHAEFWLIHLIGLPFAIVIALTVAGLFRQSNAYVCTLSFSFPTLLFALYAMSYANTSQLLQLLFGQSLLILAFWMTVKLLMGWRSKFYR